MRVVLRTGTPAELSLPDDPPIRGIVLLPDIRGLRPLFDEHGARLASEQRWAVCQPEPFPGREQLPLAERLATVADIDDATHLDDIVAAADHLEEIGASPIGVLGFCMGGMYALKAAGTGRFDRVVAFYGMIRTPEQWKGSGQRDAIDAVKSGSPGSVLALVGTADPWTPKVDVDDLEAAGATVVRYEGADHGVAHDPSRPAHRPDDAADAWRRAIAFFDEGIA
jgi:carboxymethylenebutenolidase